MWSNSFILETRKLESEKYEKNLESRITESEGLWKVIQVQRRELCWQNKVHGAKVWMKVTATGRAELEESSTNVSGHHRKACPSLTYGQSFAVCLIFQLRRHREEPIYTPPSVLLHILDGQPTALKTAHRKEECHSLHMGPQNSSPTCLQEPASRACGDSFFTWLGRLLLWGLDIQAGLCGSRTG
ncbi:uncharacterized protein LOC144288669 isoform X5 [Canis aureus]